jgi:hydroxylamine reductase
MFCYQCEQAAKGTGCTKIGVCGKDPEVAALQDLLIYALKGLSLYAHEARNEGVKVDRDINIFTIKALFSTLTNVDFDPNRFVPMIQQAVQYRDALKAKVKKDFGHGSASFKLESSEMGMVKHGQKVAERVPDTAIDPDVQSLQDIMLFGLKGVAAYADHAQILGQEDDKIYAFTHEALAQTTRTDIGVNEWVGIVLKTGEINLRAMELLDAGNTGPMDTRCRPRFRWEQRRARPSWSRAMI